MAQPTQAPRHRGPDSLAASGRLHEASPVSQSQGRESPAEHRPGVLGAILSSISSLGESLSQSLEPIVADNFQDSKASVEWLLYAQSNSPPPTPTPPKAPPSEPSTSEQGAEAKHASSSHPIKAEGSPDAPLPPTSRQRRGRRHSLSACATIANNASSQEALAAAAAVAAAIEAVDLGPPRCPSHKAKPSLNSLSTFAGRTSILPKEEVAASRTVTSAMASRATMLQKDLTKAREELSFLKARVEALEEESARRWHDQAEREEWEPNEAEEQLREQVEHLLRERSALLQQKKEIERENEKLHQLVEYYEELHMNDADDADEVEVEVDEVDDAWGEASPASYALDYPQDLAHSPLYSPFTQPLPPSSSGSLFLSSTFSSASSGEAGGVSTSSEGLSDDATEDVPNAAPSAEAQHEEQLQVPVQGKMGNEGTTERGLELQHP